MKSCQVIASDKSNLLRKVDFLLKIGFQVIAFFLSLEVQYLAIIVVNFVYKRARQLFHVVLLFFTEGYQNDCYQILKR